MQTFVIFVYKFRIDDKSHCLDQHGCCASCCGITNVKKTWLKNLMNSKAKSFILKRSPLARSDVYGSCSLPFQSFFLLNLDFLNAKSHFPLRSSFTFKKPGGGSNLPRFWWVGAPAEPKSRPIIRAKFFNETHLKPIKMTWIYWFSWI